MVTFRFDVSTQVDLLSELIHTVEKACVPHATNVCVFFVLDCYYIFDWNSPHVPFFRYGYAQSGSHGLLGFPRVSRSRPVSGALFNAFPS